MGADGGIGESDIFKGFHFFERVYTVLGFGLIEHYTFFAIFD